VKRLALALLLLASPAQAVTHSWWVSPTGTSGASGVDSTTNAKSLAWFNANAVAGDTCLIKNGDYGATDIRPTHAGNVSHYIVYVGNTAAPRGVTVRNVTADSLDGCTQCVSVKGVHATGDASFHSGKSRTAALAGYDSLTCAVVDGSLRIVGRSNVTVDRCTVGDGTAGDGFEYTSGNTDISMRRVSYVDSLHVTRSTFNLFSGGLVNVISSHGSGYCLFDTLRFTLGGTGADYGLHTTYDAVHNVWRDCYFAGSYAGSEDDKYLLNMRDNQVGNLWERDTLVQVNTPLGAKPLKVWFQTDGNPLDVNAGGSTANTYDYGDSNNTFLNCVVKVMGDIAIDDPLAKYVFQGNVFATGGNFELSKGVGFIREVTFRHNTVLCSKDHVLSASLAKIWNSRVTQNIFICTTPIGSVTGNGSVGLFCVDTTYQNGTHYRGTILVGAIPGLLGVCDSNLFYCTASSDPDSFRTIDFSAIGGGGAKMHYSHDSWYHVYGHDGASHWGNPGFPDVGVLTFNPKPDPLGIAISSNLWPDGYVGAIAAPSDVTPPTVSVTEPSGAHRWSVSEIMRIQWTASDNVAVSSVKIEYDSGALPTVWVPIAVGLSASATYFDWTCPDFTHNAATIRVTATDAASNATAASRPFRCEVPVEGDNDPLRFPE
jgi:hypothetical protein